MAAFRASLDPVPKMIAEQARPLPDPDDPDFAAAFDSLGEARVVLLGEASHGTSEFYRARAAITRRLVEKHGFTIIAVEADWPDAAHLDAFIRGGLRPSQADGPPFGRFPTWMWRNEEVAALIGWLRAHNETVPEMERKAGFFGLDLYSLNSSTQAVLAYLERIDPETAKEARRRYSCFEPWLRRPEVYGHMTMAEGFGLCEDGVLKVLRDLLEKQLDYMRQGGTAYFDAAQNARVVASAERYYRSMYRSDDDSWNLRDTHMADTLDALLSWRPDGKTAPKAVVWAHNSHIGDARETGMSDRGELNLGQLCRERHGDAVRLVGFGTHTGTVAAATDWDDPMEVKKVLPSRPDSVERLFHDSGLPRLALDLRAAPEELRELLATPLLERYIGVIYRPETERWSHYVESRLSRQFDQYVFFDQTRAVTPIAGAEKAGAAETYPFGL
ncbi:erythromycin esterase family protein [Azospirillum sp. SYSU D00513]|uniref:erythromycin esterase family protein n=1 Tax=Azospirillum sp. SYSU D00513 TaxID=2812561 RepID=UPI001A96D060|nr:erythromycin esterase family protein [Azospirillum sp. SYSU D00513]